MPDLKGFTVDAALGEIARVTSDAIGQVQAASELAARDLIAVVKARSEFQEAAVPDLVAQATAAFVQDIEHDINGRATYFALTVNGRLHDLGHVTQMPLGKYRAVVLLLPIRS